MTKNNSAEEFDSKWAEDWLPVNAIANGMIQASDGYLITGVKIVPKNIFIMDEGAQNNVLFQLTNFYNTIDYEFWLLIADRPVDINVYLSQLQLAYNQTSNSNLRKLVMQDIQKANMFMSEQYNVVDTEYFIVFREKKMDIVTKRINNLISGLAGAGLEAVQTSNSDLRMILDNYLNDGQNTNFRAVM